MLRLPLFTRLVLLVILAFWLLELQTIWSVVQWGSLTPNEIGIGSSMSISATQANLQLVITSLRANSSDARK